MRKSYIYSLLLAVSFLPLLCIGQNKKLKWTNKDKGTYAIYLDPSGIGDTAIFSLTVKFLALTDTGCIRDIKLEGNIKLGGKKHFVYDSTEYYTEEVGKSIPYLFSEYFSSGSYRITATAGKGFYPIKTEKLFFYPNTDYRITFYFVRKDYYKKK